MPTLIGFGLCAGFGFIGYLFGHGKGFDKGLQEKGKAEEFVKSMPLSGLRIEVSKDGIKELK